ncbi:hypothetical protein NGA_0461600 [Nannochloropsis gaditana CCMP526]|nr:hypothetical protein NGA_0461600 [Nannochloropsis gaditana CCMP526]EKU22848.1 hypothetical protein NGA_0461600 [Nannochloropsis gaditana CCMP526]|eukprot:XP_005853512.1 hypothetical protein NGA_0461600 [Nannochloropsis gaditana CCMP526]
MKNESQLLGLRLKVLLFRTLVITLKGARMASRDEGEGWMPK